MRLALEPRVADAHDVAGHVGRARQVGINARAAGLNSGLRAPGGLPVGVGAVGVAARAAHTRGRDVLLVVAMVDRRGRLDLARGRVGPGTAELSYAVGAWVGEMVTPSGCWCVWTLLSDLFLSLNNEGIFLCQFWLATLMPLCWQLAAVRGDDPVHVKSPFTSTHRKQGVLPSKVANIPAQISNLLGVYHPQGQ